ncbi:hypothetical protein M5224_004712 [Vibrio parahaemolyticus]|uniref:hypothetical protein n=1 Tax=Vibrio parahaemolyticus TaxID=670 RepID=UPI0006A710E7|nr:hypothetical protein [Vibrio parahaemolyticus]EGQ9971465.1 hypothetical protein [Vibrio vulnificus]EHK9101504.1 hypothetical protein [Vibrio parahaemolyticus]EIE1228001.1 hypothetical protein [Vibrio vulnificus]EIT7136882.1 hypothetical protein [Vibrio parahaemolyticus]EIU6794255.1 hypothetical protein [Vibrio parahaemolyticus]
MSNHVKLPLEDEVAPKAKPKSTLSTSNPEVDHLGSVNKSLGTGKNAQDSVVWLTILWSFGVGIGTTLLLFVFVWYYYPSAPIICATSAPIPEFPLEYLTTIWSVFIPVITLALGYMFGKRKL